MDNMTNQPRVEDVLPVRSRVSWQAIFAGAVISLAVYMVLTMLGAAIGLSLSDANIRGSTLGIAAAIWATLAFVLSLFVGGFVTTQCAVGENRQEAVVHGILMWGAVLFIMTWMIASGFRGGYGALVGAAYLNQAAGDQATATNWETVARRAGISDERIQEARRVLNPEEAAEEVSDPQNRQAALNYTTAATWWALVGTLVSIASAVGGAVLGSGPTFRFFVFQGRTRVMINRGEQLAHR